MLKINMTKDFTDIPGGRYIKEGRYSGEEFRESILLPKFKEALSTQQKLEINLDGGYGYPTSFLEEAFGGLARKEKKEEILKTLKFISEDEPALIEEIHEYIIKA